MAEKHGFDPDDNEDGHQTFVNRCKIGPPMIGRAHHATWKVPHLPQGAANDIQTIAGNSCIPWRSPRDGHLRVVAVRGGAAADIPRRARMAQPMLIACKMGICQCASGCSRWACRGHHQGEQE